MTKTDQDREAFEAAAEKAGFTVTMKYEDGSYIPWATVVARKLWDLAHERARAQGEPVAVPDGWRLVPEVAPQEVLDAFFKTMILCRPLSECWAAALAAAPAAPSAESGEVDLLPIFGGDGIGTRLSSAMEAYLADYVFGLEDGPDHELSEFERAMLEDFLNGALSDAAVNDILQEAARALASYTPALSQDITQVVE